MRFQNKWWFRGEDKITYPSSSFLLVRLCAGCLRNRARPKWVGYSATEHDRDLSEVLPLGLGQLPLPTLRSENSLARRLVRANFTPLGATPKIPQKLPIPNRDWDFFPGRAKARLSRSVAFKSNNKKTSNTIK